MHIQLPPGALDGIDAYANHARISDVHISGSPFDNVYIAGRINLIDASNWVSVTGSTLLDAERNLTIRADGGGLGRLAPPQLERRFV